MTKAKILIVDDSEGIISLLKRLLTREDFEIVTANDGEKGLKLAKEIKPDLILLDLMLPKLDGYKVCRLLKFDEAYQKIPIIMLSMRASEADRETGRETGADAYLAKPIDESVLLSKINELLKKEE